MQQSQVQYSLRAICKQRLKNMFITLRQENKDVRQYLLVVDAKTLKVVSAFLKMAELLELGITAIENLTLIRKPFKLDAIYFIQPSFDSVTRLIQDFNDPLNPQYAHAHIFFNNNIPGSITNKIKQSAYLVQKIKTFKVFNMDFSCSNDQVFSLDVENSLNMFSGKQNMVLDIAEKLSTLLVSFEKFYSFELLYRKDDQGICEQVALNTQRRLQNMLNILTNSNCEEYDNKERTCGRIHVVIVDRPMDPATPLLHDFFYQPMVYDLLDIERDFYDFSQQVKGEKMNKKFILNDYDDIFKRYKFRHIGEVLDGIPSEFKSFLSNNTTAKVQTGQLQNLDLNKMTEIVRGFPQYQEQLGIYTMHMSLIDKCWTIFEKKELKELGDIEQTLITGVDGEGKTASTSKLLSRIMTKLVNGQMMDDFEKLRLVLLTLISQQVVENDRKALSDKINGNLQNAILNLRYLGVNPQSFKKGKSSNRVSDQVKKNAKNKILSATMDLCRNTPLVETAVQQYVESGFQKPPNFEALQINCDSPYGVNQQNVSLRKNGGQLAKMMQNTYDSETANTKKKLVNQYQPQKVVFMIGGMGYNELRAVLGNPQITGQAITLAGGTELLKPNDYVRQLSNL